MRGRPPRHISPTVPNKSTTSILITPTDTLTDTQHTYYAFKDEPNQKPTETFTYIPGIHEQTPTKPIYTINHATPRKWRSIKLNLTLQGDSGANMGATNDKSLLWNYRTFSQPIKVETYDKSTTTDTPIEAPGMGIIKIIDDNGNVMDWSTLYTPNSSGTILSPQRYMREQKYTSWTQEGN